MVEVLPRSVEVQPRGAVLLAITPAMEMLHGKSAVDAMLQLVPRPLAEALAAGKVVATEWYPLEWIHALHACAQQVTGTGPELARDLGFCATTNDFRGSQRVLSAFMSPQSLVKRASDMWSRYWKGGKLEIFESGRGLGHCRFTGCTGFNRSLWMNLVGGCTGLLTVGGAHNVQARLVEGGGDEDDHALVEATWSVT